VLCAKLLRRKSVEVRAYARLDILFVVQEGVVVDPVVDSALLLPYLLLALLILLLAVMMVREIRPHQRVVLVAWGD